MSMLERWAMDEKMFPDDPIGIEKLHGPFIRYHSNGKKRLEGQCDNGIPVGKWTYYKDDGSIKKTKEY